MIYFLLIYQLSNPSYNQFHTQIDFGVDNNIDTTNLTI